MYTVPSEAPAAFAGIRRLLVHRADTARLALSVFVRSQGNFPHAIVRAAVAMGGRRPHNLFLLWRRYKNFLREGNIPIQVSGSLWQALWHYTTRNVSHKWKNDNFSSRLPG